MHVNVCVCAHAYRTLARPQRSYARTPHLPARPHARTHANAYILTYTHSKIRTQITSHHKRTYFMDEISALIRMYAYSFKHTTHNHVCMCKCVYVGRKRRVHILFTFHIHVGHAERPSPPPLSFNLPKLCCRLYGCMCMLGEWEMRVLFSCRVFIE